jgi:ABC-2 type transport system ATP-binding protein
MSILVTERLTKTYGARRGIDAIDLAVPEGSLFGFLGPNGAGKTTAIRVLLGLLRPTAGSARLFGIDCWRDGRRAKREVGYLPGDLRLYPWLHGESALRTFGRIRCRDLLGPGRRLAEEFSLDLKVKVRSMSRGMRQKLGLILALAPEPRLLILDEPTSGLDPLMQGLLHRRLRALARAGHTVFFSSHSLAEVEQLCDRIAIIRDGRIVADETLEGLRRQAGHEVVIRWPDAEAAARAEPPAFLEVHERRGATWSASIGGPIRPLFEWLAAREVEDVAIGRPDLERLFRRFYERERDGRAGAGEGREEEAS